MKPATCGRMHLGIALTLLIGSAADARVDGGAPAPPPGLDTADIERRTGARGELSAEEGVFKVDLPRSDLAVRAAGVKLTPPLGLTAWAAFKRTGESTMVMGDIVLLEDELQPVLEALRAADLDIVAIHNHMAGEEPRMLFLHYWGVGPAEQLARGVRSALDLTAKPTHGERH